MVFRYYRTDMAARYALRSFSVDCLNAIRTWVRKVPQSANFALSSGYSIESRNFRFNATEVRRSRRKTLLAGANPAAGAIRRKRYRRLTDVAYGVRCSRVLRSPRAAAIFKKTAEPKNPTRMGGEGAWRGGGV